MMRRQMGAVAAFICYALLLALRLAQAQTSGPKDSFATARLTTEEIGEILAGVERSAYDTPESWKDELRVKRVDLGGAAGIVLQGTKLLCGATGNCQIFVFRDTHGHWVSLFGDGQASTADSFQFGPAVRAPERANRRSDRGGVTIDPA